MMTCEVDGCDQEDVKRGMCLVHYHRMRRNGHTDLIIKKIPLAKCTTDDCEEQVNTTHGMCQKHYKRSLYLKSVGRDKLIERTSQERWINIVSGYAMVKHNGKLTYEHIVIAEKALGKSLPPKAIVHHTGAPDDNIGYCKLVICPDQSYHKLIHKRMKELGYENS